MARNIYPPPPPLYPVNYGPAPLPIRPETHMPLTPKTGVTKEELTKERIAADAANTTAISSKYSKPSSGIPKSDLAPGVQASLDKADTALQEHQDISGKVDKDYLLDGDKIKSSRLPSYVDDVLEYSSTSAFPATGESGKIYVAIDTNKTYRWTGTQYAEIAKGAEVVAPSTSASDAGKAADAKATGDALAGKASTADATLTRSTTWTATGLPAGYSLVSATWISDEWIIRLTDDNGDVPPFPIAGHSTDTELTFTFDDSTVVLKKSEILVLGSQSDKPLAPANDYALKSEIPSVPVKQVKRNGTALTPDANGAVDVTVPTTAADVGAATQTALAAAFTAKAYAVGDLATYNGLLYRCKGAYTATAQSAKPDADTTHWEATVVAVIVGNKADKCVPNASGNIALLDGNGNLVDSNNLISGTLGVNELVVNSGGDTSIGMGASSDEAYIYVTLRDGDRVNTRYIVVPISTSEGIATLALLQNIAPDFSESSTYAAGALCVHDSALWRCTEAVTSAGDWTGPANWAAATVEDVLAALRAGKQDTISDLATIREGAAAGATAVQPSGLANYVQKSQTAGLLKNDGTVDTNTYLTTAPVTSVNGQTGAVTLAIPDVSGKLDANKRNLLVYASTTTLAPETAVYRSSLNADGTFPAITDTGIPTAAAYYQFELELTVPSTVPSTITGPSGWTWLDGHGLPDPADLSGGETIYVSVRLDCTARTFLASVWRVA